MTGDPHRPLTWVVGGGGLLGQHVVAGLEGRAPLHRVPQIPWGGPEDAGRCLVGSARALVETAGDRPWQVIWCAGAGVTGTSGDAFEREHSMLVATLDGLSTGRPSSGSAGGSVFLASSAGGVYAGARPSPFDEFSAVAPLGDYGAAKLRAEATLARWARASGVPVAIGRIANLYGPGQNLSKAQGLVSQLCAAHLDRRPAMIWVSLDTLRDYLFAPDCAALVLDLMDRLRSEAASIPRGETLVVTKVIATQRAITIGAVIAELRRIFRRRPTIVLGASPTSSQQAKDLSLASHVWPELDRRTLTTFPAGVAATLADLQYRRQLGDTAPVPR
ncbi:MAG: NAD-dependent epimerase/dehydratase family protein [Terracoccus sp.]